MEKAAVQLEGEKSLFQMFWHLSFVFILKIRFTSLLRGKVLVMLYFHIGSKPHEKTMKQQCVSPAGYTFWLPRSVCGTELQAQWFLLKMSIFKSSSQMQFRV